MPLEINCSACGAVTFIRREPLYEGFKKVGETFSCMSCGHAFASEAEVPYRHAVKQALFTADDLTARPDVFDSDDFGRNCHHCQHYTVNPFTQRCGLHKRIVDAMDTCSDFSAKKEEQKD